MQLSILNNNNERTIEHGGTSIETNGHNMTHVSNMTHHDSLWLIWLTMTEPDWLGLESWENPQPCRWRLRTDLPNFPCWSSVTQSLAGISYCIIGERTSIKVIESSDGYRCFRQWLSGLRRVVSSLATFALSQEPMQRIKFQQMLWLFSTWPVGNPAGAAISCPFCSNCIIGERTSI